MQETPNEDGECSKNDSYIVLKDDIKIENLSFKYPGAKQNALTNINVVIPYGKITAIVGASGCGKTTLLKILLKFYRPTSGNIYVDNTNLSYLNSSLWRSLCGVVMQNGYILLQQ